MLALAAGALLANQEVSAPTQPQSMAAKSAEPLTAGQWAGEGQRAPAKPASSSAQHQRVYVRTHPLFPDCRPIYAQRVQPRRVRYGKSRWIILD